MLSGIMTTLLPDLPDAYALYQSKFGSTKISNLPYIFTSYTMALSYMKARTLILVRKDEPACILLESVLKSLKNISVTDLDLWRL